MWEYCNSWEIDLKMSCLHFDPQRKAARSYKYTQGFADNHSFKSQLFLCVSNIVI